MLLRLARARNGLLARCRQQRQPTLQRRALSSGFSAQHKNFGVVQFQTHNSLFRPVLQVPVAQNWSIVSRAFSTAKEEAKEEAKQEEEADQDPSQEQTEGEENEQHIPEIEVEAAEDGNAWLSVAKYGALFAGLYVFFEYVDFSPYIIPHVLSYVTDLIDEAKETPVPETSDYSLMLLGYIMQYEHYRTNFIKNDGIDTLMTVVALVEAGRLPLSVLRNVATTFAGVALDDECLPIYEQYPGLMGLLLRMAMSQDAELALNGFTAIKATLRNEVLKKEFVTLGGLSSLCRSIRALDPNVQNAAATLLGGFLYEFPDPTQLGLTKPQKQDMFQATAQMGFQFYEFGNQDLAILAFQVALKLSPNNPELLTQIGILQVGSSDLQDRVAGRQKLQKALRAGPGAVRTCFFLADSITKELHTRFPEDWKTLPESREQLKNSMKLLENSLSQLRRGKPTNSGVVEKDAIHPLTSNVFSLLVSLCTVLDREGEALKYANEWSLRDTNSTFAHTTYAKLLIDAGRSQEAYQLLQRTHNFDPDKPDVPFLMAQALVREQKYKEALECVDSSISLYEHNKVLIDRNVAREAARKKKLAEKEGEKDKDKKKKKKKTSEEDEEPQVSRDSVLCEHGKEQASILKSRIHYKLGEYQQALEAIDGVAETQPLGKLLARATTVPTKPRIHLLAGQTLLKMKQYEAGFERFEQACDTWLQTTCNVGDAQCKQYFDTHPTDLALLNKLGQMCVSSSSESGEAAEITAKQKMCTKYTALAQIATQ